MPIFPNNPASVAEGRSSTHINEAIKQNGANISSPLPIYERVVVEEVLFDPSIIDDKRAEYYVKTMNLSDTGFLRNLPLNTIIGKKLKDGTQVGTENSEYFFPFFPQHLMFPIKSGEHVWVFYENNKTNKYGYWMCRITEPRNVDDLNHTHADRKFNDQQEKGTASKFENGSASTTPGFGNAPTRNINGKDTPQAMGASYGDDERAYEKLLKESDSAKLHDFEDVPRFRKRPTDIVIQGSNNSLICLGTDRTGECAVNTDDSVKGKVVKGKPTKDKKGKSGTIDLVVGRGQGKKTKAKAIKNSLDNQETDKNLKTENPNEGDIDFAEDSGRVYLSMKTDVDKNFNVKLTGIEQSSGEESAGVIKFDNVRIIARKSIKFLVQPNFESQEKDCSAIIVKSNGDIVFLPSELGIIKLGGEDANVALLGSDVASVNTNGKIVATPIVSTMGGITGIAPGSVSGVFCTKILAK